MSFSKALDLLSHWFTHDPPDNVSIPQSNTLGHSPEPPPDIGIVRGQIQAKQALLIAASGRHNLLMVGPPGEGKSLLASTIPGFLPPLSRYQQATLERLYGAVSQPAPIIRPYRAIGPTITPASLLGGGRGEPIPGELSLAHLGILYFDELPQFPRSLIDSLRQPLEDRRITVTRSGQTAVYPCDIQLLASMNPCPCGYYPTENCICSEFKVVRYQSKISGPILDRIDLVCFLHPLSSRERFSPAIPNQSLRFKSVVLRAQLAQLRRQRLLNYRIGPQHVFAPQSDNPLRFTPQALELFKSTTDKGNGYSTRRAVRLARIARTIADIANSDSLTPLHISTAITFTDNSLLSLGD